MAQNNTLSTLNGYFKEVYSDSLQLLIPDGVKLINKVSFVSKEKMQGSAYHAPVTLGLEHGFSYASDGSAFLLAAAVAGATKDASISATQMVLRSNLSYAAASRAVSSKNSFGDATKWLVSNMVRSFARRLECNMFYGQGQQSATGAGYAKVFSFNTGFADKGDGTNSTVALAGNNQIGIYASEWAPGIWAASEGMVLDVINPASGGSVRGQVTVSGVDMVNRVLTLTSTTFPASTAVNDLLVPTGSWGTDFVGLHNILMNTSTSLFGINPSNYSMWAANQISAAGGPLSFALINKAISRCVEKGMDGELTALVNPRGWATLLSAQDALRKFDSSYSKSTGEQGSEAIKFYSQNGAITIEPSTFVKEGYCYLINTDEMERIGSSDVTFRRPGQGDEFFKDMENYAGYELRAYSDQALFTAAPGKMAIITGIVNG